MVASPDDGIFFDKKAQYEMDVDEEYEISNIKEIIYDHEDGFFYLLCNVLYEQSWKHVWLNTLATRFPPQARILIFLFYTCLQNVMCGHSLLVQTHSLLMSPGVQNASSRVTLGEVTCLLADPLPSACHL